MYQKEDLEIVKDVILGEIEPYQIILFGSYATGRQDESSDLDVMILTKEELNRKRKLEILYRLQRKFLYLEYRIDLLIKNWNEFKKYKGYIGTINYDVGREGKVLWSKQ
jgi:predicted nucleotidyltransferase